MVDCRNLFYTLKTNMISYSFFIFFFLFMLGRRGWGLHVEVRKGTIVIRQEWLSTSSNQSTKASVFLINIKNRKSLDTQGKFSYNLSCFPCHTYTVSWVSKIKKQRQWERSSLNCHTLKLRTRVTHSSRHTQQSNYPTMNSMSFHDLKQRTKSN